MDFPSTRWSRLDAGNDAASRRAALEALVRDYREPVVDYFRALTHTVDVEDLAQEFFVTAIDGELLSRADPERGRFRAYLKQALRNFAIDALRRRDALRRGGGAGFRSIDDVPLEAGDEPPEAMLDRAWRRQLLERAFAAAEQALAERGQSRAFAVFRDYFTAADEPTRAQLAKRHGITEFDVGNDLARAKEVFRSRLKALVIETVTSHEDLEAEIVWLFGKARATRGGP
jgi:RNA polymerase sigma factor (sigma-70 family)